MTTDTVAAAVCPECREAPCGYGCDTGANIDRLIQGQRLSAVKPRRVQRRRTKGWRMPPGAVYVGRPSRWGNPFVLGSPSGLVREPAIQHPGQPWEYEGRISAAGMRHDYHHGDGRVTVVQVRAMTPAESVACYRALVTGGGWPLDWNPAGRYPTVESIRAALAGRDLACWCPLGQPCHADVLLEIANS